MVSAGMEVLAAAALGAALEVRVTLPLHRHHKEIILVHLQMRVAAAAGVLAQLGAMAHQQLAARVALVLHQA